MIGGLIKFNIIQGQLHRIIYRFIVMSFRHRYLWYSNLNTAMKNYFDILVAFIADAFHWTIKDFQYWLLIFPVLVSVGTYHVTDSNTFGCLDFIRCKGYLEVIHPMVLALSVIGGFAGYYRSKQTVFLFVSALCCLPLLREVLGQGYSFLIVIGLPIMIVYAVDNRKKIEPLYQSRISKSFLTMTFICYITSQLLDRGVVKRVYYVLTGDRTFSDRFYSEIVEESLESLGGMFLLAVVIALYRKIPKQVS